METLDALVKLASLGTAGICIFAIFFMGTGIFRLPNDTSEIKALLMKKYMNVCIFIAIICMISGVANSYFNMNKVKIAEIKAEAAKEVYISGEVNNVRRNPGTYRLSQEKVKALESELKENPTNKEIQKKLILNEIAVKTIGN